MSTLENDKVLHPFKKVTIILLCVLFIAIGFCSNCNFFEYRPYIPVVIEILLVIFACWFIFYGLYNDNENVSAPYYIIPTLCYLSVSCLLISNRISDDFAIIAFIVSAIIWGIVVFGLTYKYSENSWFLDFISSFWLVTGVLMTLGTQISSFASPTVNLINSNIESLVYTAITGLGFNVSKGVNNYVFDLRFLLTLLMVIIFVSNDLSKTFSKDSKPTFFKIPNFKIIPPDNIESGYLLSFLKTAIYIPNLLLKFTIFISNLLIVIISTIVYYLYRLIINMALQVYNFFFSKNFLHKLCIVTCLLSIIAISITWKILSFEIFYYITDNSDFFSIGFVILIMNFLFWISVIIVTLKYILREVISLKQVFEHKLNFIIQFCTLFWISGGILYFVFLTRKIDGYNYSLGLFSIAISIVLIGVIIYLIVVSLKKNKIFNSLKRLSGDDDKV